MIESPKIRSSEGQPLGPVMNAVEMVVIGGFWLAIALFTFLFGGIFSRIILGVGPSAALLLYTAIALLLLGTAGCLLAVGLMLAGLTLQRSARRGPPH